jgi:proline iminopeptidase
MCTPVKIAYDLKDVWPEAELTVVADGGHALMEPGIAAALIRATDRFAASGA